jgi:hypothetical protein
MEFSNHQGTRRHFHPPVQKCPYQVLTTNQYVLLLEKLALGEGHQVKYVFILIPAYDIHEKCNIHEDTDPAKCNIIVKCTVLNLVDKFKYLGTVITLDGRCISEKKSQAKTAFQNMRNILCNKYLF